MKNKVFYNKKHKFTIKDIDAFSHGEYKCQFLLQNKQGQPVAVCQRSDPDFDVWKVQCGFSSVFFGTYAEAMDYCREHFCDLDGNVLNRHKE